MKKIYVIGSSSKIAEAIVRLAQGYLVVPIGRSNPHNLGGYIQSDGVTSEDSIEELFTIVQKDLAGTKQLESASLVVLSGVSSHDWRESFLVNEYLPARLSEAFSAYVCEKEIRGASIVLVSSAAAYQGAKMPYAATKASLTGILHTIARDYREKVRINSIIPSAFDSEMIADWDEEKRKKIAGNNFIGRLGTADDMADAILFAVRNEFITNSTINMTGGTVHI